MDTQKNDYNQKISIKLNRETDPFYLYFDDDVRSERVNMQFQHFHEFYEIMILFGTKAGHLIDGKYNSLQKFDVVLLKPGRLHQSIYFKGGTVQRLIINFKLPQISGLNLSIKEVEELFDMEVPILRLSDEDRNKAFYPLSVMAKSWMDKMPCADLMATGKLLEFLVKLNACKDNNHYVETEQIDYITSKMFDISSFILSNFTEDLSLDYLSDRFSISPCYLSRKFKDVLGFPLVQYVLMTRLRNAQRLLISTKKPVLLIAEESGFNYSAHFNRMFSKYCGYSPLEFRRRALRGEADLVNFNFHKDKKNQ